MLTIIVFLLLMVFFDQNDLLTQRNRQKELDKMKDNIEFMTRESGKMKEKLHNLNSDTAYLEKYARQHYHEKRDNEDLYLIVPDTTSSTSKH